MARFLGTPRYLLAQTVVVIAWVAVNAVGVFGLHWDPYPFILLNLGFSTQASYAAPFILLAQTRQASRDKAMEEAAARHRDAVAAQHTQLLRENTALTEQVHALTVAINRLLQQRAGA
jgi:uncharacterized membrane protein